MDTESDPRTPLEIIRGDDPAVVRARLAERKARKEAAREARARRKLHRSRGAR